ncbi:MAG TPA: hypothetical protein VK590_03175 [Saprospiraceae bacterium]|nr:hypothetical protein [Saprospiraceae bacterium]
MIFDPGTKVRLRPPRNYLIFDRVMNHNDIAIVKSSLEADLTVEWYGSYTAEINVCDFDEVEDPNDLIKNLL